MSAQPDLAPLGPTPADRALAILRARSRALIRAQSERAIVGATAFLVAVGSILACLGGANALLFDNLQELAAAGGGGVGLFLASRRHGPPTRRLLVALAVSVAGAFCGMLAWDLAPAAGPALEDAGDVFFVASVVLGVAAILPAIFGGLGRGLLAGVATDALILFLAGVTVVAALWSGSGVATGDHWASLGAVVLVAVTGGGVFALIARRIPPSAGGPWALFVGATIIGLAWLTWVGDAGASSTVGLGDFMFSAGILLIAQGGVTWDTRASESPAFERVARVFAAGLPVAAILGSLAITVATHGPAVIDLVGISTGAVIVTSVGRQMHLYAREARAREGERWAARRLADEIRERAATLVSLERLLPGRTPEETARQVCGEALRLDGIDLAVVRAYGADGAVVPLAVEGLGPRAADLAGRPLEADQAALVRLRAAGGAWTFAPGDDETSRYGATLRALGVRATVNAPLRWNDAIIGDIGLGTCSADLAVPLSERLSTVEEFGVVVAALLGPAMAERDRALALRRTIEAVIAGGAFDPVFQPIVDLTTGDIVGYEALTRFSDGTPPDRRFAEAAEAGIGVALEQACLRAALTAAAVLPPQAYLSVNVSPELVHAGPLGPLLAGLERPIALEITEHVAIDDYGALRRELKSLGPTVRLAVDDAGAGYASFHHILELAPDFVKLDVGLVRGIDADPARQALLAGMTYFAVKRKIRLIAEGIETVSELETLRSLAILYGQGYLLGRPQDGRRPGPWPAKVALGGLS